jgi:hypothetical protein
MPEITSQCDLPRSGYSRRELLRVGGLSLFGGMTLPNLLKADERTKPRGAAKSVILFNLLGGPSHQDMFDLKPDAPVEIRGEFKPISTSLPGLQICELLPNTARLMHRASLIRSITHSYNSHNPLAMMTGFPNGENGQLTADRTDPPDIGAVCQYLGIGSQNVPGAVCLPCYPGWGESGQYPGIRRPGPYGGYLGSQYDPMFSLCQPTFAKIEKPGPYNPVMPIGEPLMPSLESLPGMSSARLNRRRSVLDQIDQRFETLTSSRAVDRMDKFQTRAFSMLSSSRTRDAFDLSRETDALKDRYGRNLYGSSLIVARRLVEAGVPFVSVHQEIFGHHGHAYDMHENNFSMLRDFNLPLLDRLLPALVEDLDERGLLDSTLVVVMGEMGRAPKVNAKAGRDHWPQCGFSLMIGGGVKQGTVFGSTDKQAAYPESHPVSPGDVVATIYHLLGIDPHMTVSELDGRPVPIAHGGNPIRGIIA